MSPRRPTGRPRGRPRKSPAPDPAPRRPRGRPPGQTEPMAPALWLRLSPAERAEVESRALAAGVSISAWVRRVVRRGLGLEP